MANQENNSKIYKKKIQQNRLKGNFAPHVWHFSRLQQFMFI